MSLVPLQLPEPWAGVPVSLTRTRSKPSAPVKPGTAHNAAEAHRMRIQDAIQGNLGRLWASGTRYVTLSSATNALWHLSGLQVGLFISMIPLIYHRNTIADLSKFLYSDSESKVRKDDLRMALRVRTLRKPWTPSHPASRLH